LEFETRQTGTAVRSRNTATEKLKQEPHRTVKYECSSLYVRTSQTLT
jgi:hypothetical protein